jgi:hypothetical protein
MSLPCRRILPVLLLMLAACAPVQAPQSDIPPERVKEIFSRIDAQDSTVKKSEAWLRGAYRSISIRKLADVPPQEYDKYRQYVKDGEVYIIVHPGYFPFFDKWDVTPIETDYRKGYPAQNIAQRATAVLPAENVAYRVAREQERVARDFLEFMSQEGRLVVLVLPRNYLEHLTYGYVPGYDEYARYINELTNGAENILWLESDTHNSGYLLDADLAMLGSFLDAAGVRTIRLGGGFLGKCLDNFYGSLRKRYAYDAISYVTEITSFSPADMVTDRASLITSTGKLKYSGLRKYFESVAFNRTTNERLRWSNLTLYRVYRSR